MGSNTYQNIYDRAKSRSIEWIQWGGTIIPGNRCIWCQSRSKPSAIEGQNAGPREWSTQQHSAAAKIVHKQKPIKCRACYSSMEKEVLGILNGLEKIHYYCSAHDIDMITIQLRLCIMCDNLHSLKDHAAYKHALLVNKQCYLIFDSYIIIILCVYCSLCYSHTWKMMIVICRS